MDVEDQLLPGYWSNPGPGLCYYTLDCVAVADVIRSAQILAIQLILVIFGSYTL